MSDVSNIGSGRRGQTARPTGAAALNISMPQRAAVIISILGEEAAKPIIEKLDSVALEKVEAMLDNIHTIPANTTAQIVIEFLEFLTGTPGVLLNGKNQVRQLITQIEAMRKSPFSDAEVGEDGFAELDLSALGLDDEPSVWERLAKHDAERVATYLNRLTPNLIALIMRQMSVTQSSEIFNFIDEDKLPNVMGYLVDTGPDDPAINEVIERMVEIEFLCSEQDVSDADREHLQSMGELLSLIPATKRDKIVSFLESEHEGKLIDIQKSLFTIEGLPETLPRNAIPIVMKELDAAMAVKLIASFQGEYDDVAEFFLSNISSRQATQIKDDVARVGGLSPEEAEAVQRDLLLKLMELKRDGVINLM